MLEIISKARRLKRLRAARIAALQRLTAAKARRDTQNQHAAELALREATHALMKAEGKR